MNKKISAEFLGTLILVFFGVGAAVLGTGDGTTGNGLHGISMAFGFSIVAAAYGLGAMSGAHLNPAVSLGVLLAGRMRGAEFGAYVVAQLAGGIAGALIVWAIASGAPGFAGLAIGLTLAAIHLVGIRVTGVSVNPARSIGPALFVGGTAISQLWEFIVAPLAGGALAGLAHAAGPTRKD
ncbi:MAG: aquaporin [Sphingomonadales bacterium]|nr:aquaporin [Sphingomonadales bacterium]